MSSIIKVDQIQLADGSTPTAGDLGLNTTGGVLQVVSASSGSYLEVSSTSYTDATGMSATITPSSTSSKILVIMQMPVTLIRATNDRHAVKTKILRNTDTFFIHDQQLRMGAGTDNAGEIFFSATTLCNKLDSPSTTSALTYKVQFAAETTANSGRVRMNNDAGAGTSTGTANLILMEIAG